MKSLPWILVIVLLILLSALWIFYPQNQSQEITNLQQKNDSLQIEISRGLKKAEELSQQRHRDSVQAVQSKVVYDLKVRRLEGRISDLKRNPLIVRIREEVKEVDSLIVAYDSTLQVKDNRIDELQGQLYDSQKLAASAEENFQTTIANYDKVHDNLLAQVDFWQKEAKRQKRQKKGAVILGILIGAAGIAL